MCALQLLWMHTSTCSYLMFAHALLLWLFVIVVLNEVSRDADYGIILPRENVGLFFCQSVLVAFLPTGENITLFYSWFCLKPSYLMHSVDSLYWTHGQPHHESWICGWRQLSEHKRIAGPPAFWSPRQLFGEHNTASHFKQWGHQQKAQRLDKCGVKQTLGKAHLFTVWEMKQEGRVLPRLTSARNDWTSCMVACLPLPGKPALIWGVTNQC